MGITPIYGSFVKSPCDLFRQNKPANFPCGMFVLNFIVNCIPVENLLRPFSCNGVVAFHYGARVLVVSFLTMLTLKTVVKMFFVVDFDRKSAVPERKVMIWMGVVSSF